MKCSICDKDLACGWWCTACHQTKSDSRRIAEFRAEWKSGGLSFGPIECIVTVLMIVIVVAFCLGR